MFIHYALGASMAVHLLGSHSYDECKYYTQYGGEKLIAHSRTLTKDRRNEGNKYLKMKVQNLSTYNVVNSLPTFSHCTIQHCEVNEAERQGAMSGRV